MSGTLSAVPTAHLVLVQGHHSRWLSTVDSACLQHADRSGDGHSHPQPHGKEDPDGELPSRLLAVLVAPLGAVLVSPTVPVLVEVRLGELRRAADRAALQVWRR
jgi:hypothetical protein